MTAAPTAAALTLDIIESGYTGVDSESGNFATFGVILSNPTELAVYQMMLVVAFYGANDRLLASEEFSVSLLPGQASAIGGQVAGAGRASRLEVQLPSDMSDYFLGSATRPLCGGLPHGTVETYAVESRGRGGRTVTSGTLTNNLLMGEGAWLVLTAIYRDVNGAIIGGAHDEGRAFDDGETARFELIDRRAPAHVSATEVFWQLLWTPGVCMF